MYEGSSLLHFAEDRLQIAALAFMAIIYALKIRWILSYPAGRDRQAPPPGSATSGPKGARRSLAAIAMPWTMASTREHPLRYAQFVVFHVCVALSIAMSFVIPYAPGWLDNGALVAGAQALFAAAALAGTMRLVRRIANPYMRAISSPDDYFSMLLLVIWLASSFFAAPNNRQQSELPLLVYFFLTAFFLIYVPFSKISHYLYYPFARWYLGRTLGHRGVYPLVRGA